MSVSTSIALLVFTTVAKKSDAVKISQHLLKSRLAACVTTLPRAESRYVWKKKICTEGEYVLLIKTHSNKFPPLKKLLSEIHPYDCPEIIGVPIDKISPPYSAWLRNCLK